MVGPLFLNSFLLWDVRQMLALNEWRKKNKPIVPKLFHAIAETEVLNTLATIHFNHANWCLPKLTDKHFVFESKDLGHPLIPEKERVDNDFLIEKNTLISLVTGSNMAGKSTFLRSIGINIVLAQVGAPVCAQHFTLSPVRLMTSMLVSDNLAENTSTFYAELKKLKTIIEAVNNSEKVFVLLDEILRGTNSHDRHTGSTAFITQLIRHHAFAVIATHDLELADLKKGFSQSLENYHFDVQVKGEELFFDYKLKEGVCHSLNASLLMKKIGIELQN
jgi:DNA mismatch repair ATPase MutS